MMVPPHGLEPRTYLLQINCSCSSARWNTILIQHHRVKVINLGTPPGTTLEEKWLQFVRKLVSGKDSFVGRSGMRRGELLNITWDMSSGIRNKHVIDLKSKNKKKIELKLFT